MLILLDEHVSIEGHIFSGAKKDRLLLFFSGSYKETLKKDSRKEGYTFLDLLSGNTVYVSNHQLTLYKGNVIED
jgi:hypothetical protein